MIAWAWIAVAAVVVAAFGLTGRSMYRPETGRHAAGRDEAARDEATVAWLRSLPSGLRARTIMPLARARVTVAAWRLTLARAGRGAPGGVITDSGPLPPLPLPDVIWTASRPVTRHDLAVFRDHLGAVLADLESGPADPGLDHLERRWADSTGTFTAITQHRPSGAGEDRNTAITQETE